MAWSWDVVAGPLSPDEKHRRREAIDLHANIAHVSALAVAAIAGLVMLLLRLRPCPPPVYAQVPTSPVAKARRTRFRRFDAHHLLSRIRWWLGDDLGGGAGRRHEWIVGLVWAGWLLALCVRDTGSDFLHLTKRMGAVAVSQLPVLYLVSLKAFGSSHEVVKRLHAVLGRLVGLLLLLHVVCYNYFFVVAGIWPRRLLDLIVVYGVVAFVLLLALGVSATASVRRASYRLFIRVHLVVALLVPLLVFFHAPPVRLYLVEAFLALIVDLFVRKLRSVNVPSTLVFLPDANLVAVEATVPPRISRALSDSPAAYVYLSLPQPRGAFDFLHNPFTVASSDDQRGTLTLVARVRNGPVTRTLARLASSSSSSSRKHTLIIDGPYGSVARRLIARHPARVLLIAGGIGATFILPIHRFLREHLPEARLRLIWAVRQPADTTWATEADLVPEDAQLFVTAGSLPPNDDAIEMRPLPSSGSTISNHHLHRGRPDLDTVVDAVFRQGHEDPVAVLVCGPAGLAADVRRRVRPWVIQGRDAWWHSESFGC
ncbi:hypothetical protein L249_7585 [Ophiocordyceps polyrhachis-furcata BCC 54312]|uniref:ferric-chelate reductase (NADPH) n=1 Tax=Ophiocordyceps polyrhachis-furcata BCC 54312 TaxID=1330021 RepID=A0A367L9V9_9HYPO|nr:hypothetical protein L249_7585 [Ophiocordyceps polyrhachis-furcata BCC 54312]